MLCVHGRVPRLALSQPARQRKLHVSALCTPRLSAFAGSRVVAARALLFAWDGLDQLLHGRHQPLTAGLLCVGPAQAPFPREPPVAASAPLLWALAASSGGLTRLLPGQPVRRPS